MAKPNSRSAAPTAVSYPRLRPGVVSSIGRREENQDRMTSILCPHGEVFAIADGMGGYKGGALAARIVCESIERVFRELKTGVPVRSFIQTAVENANREIYVLGTSGDPATSGAGSTLVLGFFERANGSYQLSVAHVGDSRAYLFRDGQITRLTRDHSTVQRLLDDGLITASQARNHPDAGVLVRAIGKQPVVEPDFSRPVTLREGDLVLLCSDGLCGFVEDPRIEQILLTSFIVPPQELANRLAEEAMRAGSSDNITVQVVRLGDPKGVRPRILPERRSEPAQAMANHRFWLQVAAFALIFAAVAVAGSFLVKRYLAPAPKEQPPAGVKIVPEKSDDVRIAPQKASGGGKQSNSNPTQGGGKSGPNSQPPSVPPTNPPPPPPAKPQEQPEPGAPKNDPNPNANLTDIDPNTGQPIKASTKAPEQNERKKW